MLIPITIETAIELSLIHIYPQVKFMQGSVQQITKEGDRFAVLVKDRKIITDVLFILRDSIAPNSLIELSLIHI